MTIFLGWWLGGTLAGAAASSAGAGVQRNGWVWKACRRCGAGISSDLTACQVAATPAGSWNVGILGLLLQVLLL
jgi:hypothetical protein